MPLNPPRKQSPAGEVLPKSFEGLRLTSYQDSGGVWTIGWGHTQGVRKGQTISPEVAESFFRADIAGAVLEVNRLCDTATQNQFDALVDFAFNLGAGSLEASTLLKLHNAGDHAGAAGQFGRWIHGAGEVSPGLIRRRAAEAQLYSQP
jgi:lysozyme